MKTPSTLKTPFSGVNTHLHAQHCADSNQDEIVPPRVVLGVTNSPTVDGNSSVTMNPSMCSSASSHEATLTLICGTVKFLVDAQLANQGQPLTISLASALDGRETLGLAPLKEEPRGRNGYGRRLVHPFAVRMHHHAACDVLLL